MTKKTRLWKKIETLYKNNFHIDPKTLETISNYNVLLLCVSGLSNIEISKFLDTDTIIVHNIIQKNLNFNGWKTSLSINPYYFYHKLSEYDTISKDTYRFLITKETSFDDEQVLSIAFDICSIFDTIYHNILNLQNRKEY